MRRFGLMLLIIVASLSICEAKPIELGTNKQLLFDDLFLAESTRVRLRVNTPYQDPEPVLVGDKPWEQRTCAYSTVLLDDGKFRMWYDVINLDDEGKQTRRHVCYAESRDGVHWEKPNLGLVEYEGSKENNIVAPPNSDSSQQGASVFRDDHGPASQRYKLWTKYEPSDEEQKKGIKRGLWTMASPDGLRWELLQNEGSPLRCGCAADSQAVCFWDKDLGKYVGLVRMKKGETKTRERDCSVGLVISDDFRNWTLAKEVFRADENIAVPTDNVRNQPFVNLYTPVGIKVPGTPNAYVLLPTPYYHWAKPEGYPATIDVGIATSRDLENWWQPERSEWEPFLRHGLDGSATSGMLFLNPSVVEVGDEYWFYYTAIGADHSSSAKKETKGGVFRARLYRDRFICVEANYDVGEFTTPVLTFGGDKLEVNMDGSAGGWLQVEIQSADGRPIDGYRLDQCDSRIRGNSLNKQVSWQDKENLSELIGKPVKLRFVMRSMRLYAFRFVK